MALGLVVDRLQAERPGLRIEVMHAPTVECAKAALALGGAGCPVDAMLLVAGRVVRDWPEAWVHVFDANSRFLGVLAWTVEALDQAKYPCVWSINSLSLERLLTAIEMRRRADACGRSGR